MNMIEYESVIEALLFAAGRPLTIADIASTIEHDQATTRALVLNLASKYETQRRGITIMQLEDSFQMCTNPRHFHYLQRMFGETQKKALTPPLLETLAIIAYKQPITKAQIEHIRGVSAGHCVNKLVEHGLVEECGRAQTLGKPVMFSTTSEFLKHFGISSLAQLPPLEDDYAALEAEASAELANIP